MSCEHLICARCGGPVSEGRCPACRTAKAEVHHHSQVSYRPHILIASVLLILLLAALAAHGSF